MKLTMPNSLHTYWIRYNYMTTKVGFTGTQHGMTDAQKNILSNFKVWYGEIEFHHGGCIGADLQLHYIAKKKKIQVVVHPPTDRKKYAGGLDFDIIPPLPIFRKPKPYLERNHDIVDETEYLIATPSTANEQLRSGTWATVRYAKKCGKKVILILPDGTVKEY